jgi:DNA (cytosine-5)-methyltransferase 1
MMPRPTIYYNDNDPQVCAWIRQLMFDGLIPYGMVDSRSILDVRPADLEGFTQCHFFCGIAGWAYALKLAGWPATRPVWTGSPPCQPFSAAGKLEGRDDARHLAPHFISLVRACRPPVLFGEQVASSAVFGKSAKRVGGEPEWAWLDDLSDRLEAARYAVGASDIPAAGVGAPHIRQRTFFGAVRLADAAVRRCEPRERDGRICVSDNGAGAATIQSGTQSASERLADATSAGSQGRDGKHPDPGGRQETSRHSGSCSADLTLAGAGPSGTDHGGWDNVDWLFCRDGKWRPVKSSVQRVVDGLPGGVVPCCDFVPASSPLAQTVRRVMRLRGYGNAIVPQAAALFIKAFDTTVNKWQ